MLASFADSLMEHVWNNNRFAATPVDRTGGAASLNCAGVADDQSPARGRRLDRLHPDVAASNAALKAARKPSSIKVFEGADHGFLADYRPSYNAAAAKAARGEGLAWFKKGL